MQPFVFGMTFAPRRTLIHVENLFVAFFKSPRSHIFRRKKRDHLTPVNFP